MEPEGIILVNSPITTFQQSLTHSAMIALSLEKLAYKWCVLFEEMLTAKLMLNQMWTAIRFLKLVNSSYSGLQATTVHKDVT